MPVPAPNLMSETISLEITQIVSSQLTIEKISIASSSAIKDNLGLRLRKVDDCTSTDWIDQRIGKD